MLGIDERVKEVLFLVVVGAVESKQSGQRHAYLKAAS